MGKNIMMVAVMAVFLAVFGAFYFKDRAANQNTDTAPHKVNAHTENPVQPQQEIKVDRMPPQPREAKGLAPAMSGDLTIFDQDMPPQP